MNRRAFVRYLTAMGLGMTSSRELFSQQERGVNRDFNDAAKGAVGRGLEYLKARQRDDGTFGIDNYQKNVGVCSLCALAWMASGSSPDRGKYQTEIEKCLRFILSQATQSGFMTNKEAQSRGPMYEHGFATLFLAEAVGMSRDVRVKKTLEKGVQVILDSQNTEGGWRYLPQRNDADVSVTACQVMALRGARNAGIFVPNDTIEKAVGYLKRAQNPDGGFLYMGDERESAFPRSAAAIVSLFNAGLHDEEMIERGLKYLAAHPPERPLQDVDGHYFYGHYYAVQAMWQAGGKHWEEWFPLIRDLLVTMQKDDGRWEDGIGAEYATAMACIILQVPRNLLPILQR